jgi:hypothetical protein
MSEGRVEPAVPPEVPKLSRRCLMIGVPLAALTALSRAASVRAAGEVLQLEWSRLVPPAPPRPASAGPVVAEGIVDLEEFARRTAPDLPEPIPPPAPHARLSEPEDRWMSRPRVSRRPPAAIVRELDGRRVRIGGYVVPLELESRLVRELLLVPFVGACIHVPPPPSNQVIFVTFPQGLALQGLFDPVWVTGRMSVALATTELADAGYAIAAERIERR